MLLFSILTIVRLLRCEFVIINMVSRRKISLAIGGLVFGSSAWYKKNTILTGGLNINEYSTEENLFGSIEYTIQVENFNPISSSNGRLVIKTVFEDGSSIRETEKISLSALSSETYSIIINPSLEDRIRGEFESEVWVE